MPLIRTPAIILHSLRYGDTSRILKLFTPEHGVRSVIAKGAASPKSRFGGLLEPFTGGEAQFNLREGRDLHTLTGFTLLRARQGIGRDLAAFAGASLLSEILLRFGTEEPQRNVYDAFSLLLDRLAGEPGYPAGTALAGLWHLVALFGFQPQIDACVRCGRMFDPEESTRFDVEAGGFVGFECRPSGRVLPPEARRDIAGMCRTAEDLPAAERARLHADLIHLFLTAHFGGGTLRSLPLYLEQLR